MNTPSDKAEMKEQQTQPDSAQITSKRKFEHWLNAPEFSRNVLRVLPKHMTPDRMIQIATNALNRNPDLLQCTQSSFFAALMRLSEIGIEPDGYHAHLIPFNNNKTKCKEVQLIIDYKGLVTVIRRNPAIAVVKGGIVRASDSFVYQEGSSRVFNHVPAFKENDSIRGAYSFVKFVQVDDWELDYQPIWKIEQVRQRSRAKDSGPWVSDYEEMCIKTVLRHHAKTLPLRAEERVAVQADDDQFEVTSFSGKALPVRPAEVKSEPPALDTAVEGETSMGTEQAVDYDRLSALMVKDKVTDAEVITVLKSHNRDVGDADNTGVIGDLPPDTLQLSIVMWPSIVFGIAKNREATKQA